MVKKLSFHIVCWALVFIFWCSIYYHMEPSLMIAVVLVAICVVFSVITYYTTNLVLVPRLLYRRKYYALASSLLLLILVAGSLCAYMEYVAYEYMMAADLKWNFVKLFYNAYIQLFYIAAIAGCIRFFRDKYKVEKNLELIGKENAENELKFLKAQLNPHFVFNSLNTIYFQIPKESEDARNTLLMFSGLLRYQLYECNTDKISIYKEITYIKNYVDLQKERKNNLYQFSFDHSSVKTDFLIAPLLLMPFIENAFKYVSNHKDKLNIIDIKMEDDAQQFRLFVYNTKDPAGIRRNSLLEVSAVGTRDSSIVPGIGLNNVKRRLELLYPGKFVLDIQEECSSYTINLTIQL